MAIEQVKTSTITVPQRVEASAELKVDLAQFVALTVGQKQIYLAGLKGDERFTSILPRLEAVLTCELGMPASAPVKAVAPVEPTSEKHGLGFTDVAKLLEQVTKQGYGDSAYWALTASDLARTTHALGHLVGKLAELEHGSVQTTLQGLAQELGNVSSKGYGDSSFWSAATTKIHNTAHNVAQQLRSLSTVETATLPPKVALSLLVDVALTTSSKGYGDCDYWSKAAKNVAETAHIAGAGVALVAQQLGEPDRTTIGNIGERLLKVSNGGYGDSSYWSNRTAEVAKTTHDLASTLKAAIGALA